MMRMEVFRFGNNESFPSLTFQQNYYGLPRKPILFRGLTINRKWVFGLLVKYTESQASIRTPEHKIIDVRPETVAQYTGKIDIEEKRIFVDDFIFSIQPLYANDDMGSYVRAYRMGEITHMVPCVSIVTYGNNGYEMEGIENGYSGNVHEDGHLPTWGSQLLPEYDSDGYCEIGYKKIGNAFDNPSLFNEDSYALVDRYDWYVGREKAKNKGKHLPREFYLYCLELALTDFNLS